MVLAVAGAGIALGVVVVRAWRGRPSLLASARSLDEALGLSEVVASGWAFERDERKGEMASFAVERARRAVADVAVERVLVPSRSVRSQNERWWLAGAAAAAVLGIAVGGIDRVLVERTIHPVTDREATAAAELKKAAEQVAANAPRDAEDAKSRKVDEVLDGARRASEAAKRGDRRRAQEALEDMRKAARALEVEEREQARSLRALREELEGASAAAKGSDDGAGKESARPARPSATASEALAKLKKELESGSGDDAAVRKMIERLERAESAARAAGDKSGKQNAGEGDKESSGRKGEGTKGEAAREAWSRAAAALKEAREAAARGDSAAAKRAMERAEREISALEKARSDDLSRAGAMAKVADEASELDRSMHAAMSGDRSGGDGKDGMDGMPGRDGAGKGKSAMNGKDDPSGASGASGSAGPGGSDRSPDPEQRRVKVSGDLQARTDVREGERAVSAIEGMGRGGDPKAYAEIFPSYDTVVEDGLREETVPAARRPIVRRYFSSIRPGGDEEESRKRP